MIFVVDKKSDISLDTMVVAKYKCNSSCDVFQFKNVDEGLLNIKLDCHCVLE